MPVTKQSTRIALIISVMLILIACLLQFFVLNKPAKININASSTLMDAIDISDLSTAEFRYKGIAEVYANEEKTKVKCRVCYSAVVKAGIDMKEVQLAIDQDSKTVTAALPAIDLKVTVVDEQSMVTLPADAVIGYNEMLKASREDAENEARQSEELMATAEENLKATIEGLLYPILNPQGYVLKWK